MAGKKEVTAATMEIGAKGGGKHWTKAELDARSAAAESVRRKGRVVMFMPDWLGDEGQRIWRRIRRHAAGLDLLDNLDTDVLAVYCDAVAKYNQATKGLIILNEEGQPTATEDQIKILQAWARLVKSLADTLGFTPGARARLVKKKADEILDDFEKAFG